MKRVDVTYVLLNDDHKNVLMVKNKGEKSSYYTLPGGAVEQGETLKEAALREVKEETGLDVQINDVLSVSEAFFEERGHHVIFFTFSGKIIGGEIHLSRPEEIEEITWMDSKMAKEYVQIDSKATVPYILRGTIPKA
ncbi:NUDIX hydrolase [Metabacillus idriensis]|uniref:NUDIX hydrolase n=1 Tax=Metabacillus idriensis TaxID=324768 RepID=UPI00174E89EA|nr:NUDIX hydrolase [Metabacillus idriensis]